MAKVTIEKLVKVYHGDSKKPFRAVKSIDLEVHDKEFMVLVGPSGCGKSTTLRMIAGLEDITGGTLMIGDRIMNDVEPKNRGIAMVFQNYALYPHMTVFDNMAFGLKLDKAPREEIKRRVDEAANILGLETMLERKPKALSGGQRQRVAVGRAIVRKPDVFLFDEPLSNLDAKMRVQMRTEISRLHATLDATMIYVTHDQVEAMTMGDRICVMKDGNIMQIDEPIPLYSRPQNMFVAGFIGSPPMNFFSGKVEANGDDLNFVGCKEETEFLLKLNDTLSRRARNYIDKKIVLGIRPEDIAETQVSPTSEKGLIIQAKVDVSEPMGSETYIYLNSGGHNFIARVHSDRRFETNQIINLSFDPEKIHLFDPESEAVIS